ncbi:hypothetical protein [Archaeoglobus veneficus]|uniref:hypothetical protein n=1 Tax=Archaeoglobus veneficus TaxID=58290 RepID=UPI00069489A4|nr:hypothetical protein [Archaeoglobus veneficus]
MEEKAIFFLCCTSCQSHIPDHFCIITPDRPSPCGITYERALRSKLFIRVPKGRQLGVDEFEGVNEFARKFGIERVKLHSVLSYPPLTALHQLIIFYIPELDGFGIVDRSYKKMTPIGLTFQEMEKIMPGRQVEGFIGASFAYLKSRKFLAGENKPVVWASPKVEQKLKSVHLTFSHL